MSEEYYEVTADLQSCFDCVNFNNCLHRRGAQVRRVLTNALWHNKSDKSEELLNSDFSQAWLDHPDVSVPSAVRPAFTAVNSRVMAIYKLSRWYIHGQKPVKNSRLRSCFCVLCVTVVSTSKRSEEISERFGIKNPQKRRRESRVRLDKAMSQTAVPLARDVDLRHGD